MNSRWQLTDNFDPFDHEIGSNSQYIRYSENCRSMHQMEGLYNEHKRSCGEHGFVFSFLS